MNLKMLLAVLGLVGAIPVFCQVTPEGIRGGAPLAVGVGYSNYYTDWNGRLEGPAVWIDWGPSFLHGFGIEVEGRDLNYGRTKAQSNLRFDTAGGGALYTLRCNPTFHLYAKYLVSYGSTDFNVGVPTYTHDTRTDYAPGGGLELRMFRDVWVRGDYEYQFWPDFFKHHTQNPQGFTIGLSYDLRNIHRRR